MGKQPSKDSEQSKTPSPLSPKQGTKSTGKQEFSFDFVEGQYQVLQEFCLPGQIGSVASTKGFDGHTKLIASQPAGGYTLLPVYYQEYRENTKQVSRLYITIGMCIISYFLQRSVYLSLYLCLSICLFVFLYIVGAYHGCLSMAAFLCLPVVQSHQLVTSVSRSLSVCSCM